jgi:phage I-like protein
MFEMLKGKLNALSAYAWVAVAIIIVLLLAAVGVQTARLGGAQSTIKANEETISSLNTKYEGQKEENGRLAGIIDQQKDIDKAKDESSQRTENRSEKVQKAKTGTIAKVQKVDPTRYVSNETVDALQQFAADMKPAYEELKKEA